MSSTVQDDPLRQEAQEVIAEATLLGFIPYFSDDLSELWTEGVPKDRLLLRWDTGNGSWRDFLQAGKGLGARVIYIETALFHWEDVSASLEELGEEKGLEPSKLEETLKEAERFKNREGKVQDLVLAFLAEGVWHVYHHPADWVSQYQTLLSGLEEEEEIAEEESGLSEEELERYSHQLAQCLPFGRSEKKNIRREIARRLFKDRLERLEPHIEEIVETAIGIFETEVRPNKERALAQEAHRLMEGGLSRRKVGERLNLSWQKLNRLLLDFPCQET